ncbi:hypothetical protein PAXRUDRAFT_622916 [Paxillus rubicundulus Ve08.2h10]|uniref:Uncharacterized protein n=1 Tax=Paxillus rubicundulus Ve08.2h10 TaxID=930991 RepID=A0A0D0DT32_9AGAM|nr:hypothetical protein PAXRUDRAFT_622916 [Paxillus rubicundulus Ve08.2h10]
MHIFWTRTRTRISGYIHYFHHRKDCCRKMYITTYHYLSSAICSTPSHNFSNTHIPAPTRQVTATFCQIRVPFSSLFWRHLSSLCSRRFSLQRPGHTIVEFSIFIGWSHLGYHGLVRMI